MMIMTMMMSMLKNSHNLSSQIMRGLSSGSPINDENCDCGDNGVRSWMVSFGAYKVNPWLQRSRWLDKGLKA